MNDVRSAGPHARVFTRRDDRFNVSALALGALAATPLTAGAIVATDLFTLGGFAPNDGATAVYAADAGRFFGQKRVSPTAWHATVWSAANPNGVDLHPASALSSTIRQVSGTQYAGVTTPTIGGPDHAALWTGSGATSVDLHSGAFEATSLNGVGGGQQIGRGRELTSGHDHALLWSGSAGSVIDLHPAGWLDSYGGATDGAQQVGSGVPVFTPPNPPAYHALLWTGSAASYVDLNPVGFTDSGAGDVKDGMQVGAASHGFGSMPRAFYWTGTAASGVELHPAAFDYSQANATDGDHQVGYAGLTSSSGTHAAYWDDTAASFVDLHMLLPNALSFTTSTAFSIANGVIYGTATDTSGSIHAISWSLVPEPGSLGLLAMVGSVALRRRER